MPTATHQYSDHNQGYVPDARLEKGRGVCNVDTGAGTPLADLVSHIILYIYPFDTRVVLLTRCLLCLKSRHTLTSECCFSFSRSNLNWILRPSLNSIGPEIPFISTCNKNHCGFALMRVLSVLHAWIRLPYSARRNIRQIELEITSGLLSIYIYIQCSNENVSINPHLFLSHWYW